MSSSLDLELLKRIPGWDRFSANFPNLIAFDTETTGLKSYLNCPVVIGAIEVNNGKLTAHEFQLCPRAGAEIDPKALAVNGLTAEKILSFPPAEIGLTDFFKLWRNAKPMFVLGFNTEFDIGFLENAKRVAKVVQPRVEWPFLDAAQLAAPIFNQCAMPNLKLVSFYKLMRENFALDFLPELEAHTALGDTFATLALYIFCHNFINIPA